MAIPSRAGAPAGRLVGVLILLIVFSGPLVFMALGSLGQPGLPPSEGQVDLVPDRPRWDNYSTAAGLVPLARQLVNTAAVVGVAVPVSVVVASLAGFAIAVGRRRQARLLILASLFAAFVPAAALWVPRVVVLKYLGLAGHPLSVTFPALIGTSPLFTLLFAVAFRQIPLSTVDAARSEGLGVLRTWWQVALPQVRGTTFAVAALSFVFHWGNVVEPLLLLTRETNQTVALGIRTLASLEPTFYPIFLAGAVLATLPGVVMFLLAQRNVFRVLSADEGTGRS